MIDVLIVIVCSYIIGSLPTAIIAGKWLKKIDIRDYGSGNAGATNVFRTLGWKAGLTVLLVDMFKGFVPVFWLAGIIHQNPEALIYYQILAGICAILGHIWTVFAGFRGGKGVGTSAGVFLGLAPLALGLALLVFIIVVWLSRYVSLGSILAALVFLIILILQKFVFNMQIPDALLYVGIIIVSFIWIAHRENIKRLLNGEENKLKFGEKNKNDEVG
ncbi:MAG: glycerol-3-phosphate 1-O-acyltransferase PlsY [Calditrichaceae bacterium]